MRDLATDAQGNIYAVGGTASNDFPTTPGAFDRTHDDSPNGTVKHYDVFVTKFDSTGKLIWSTLLGGPGYDRAYAVEVDAQGFVYIGGRAGVGFPVTPGAAQTTFQGGGVQLYGEEDGFVCKLRPDGSALVFCTYFGTTDYNIVRDIDIDGQGNVYLASSTTVSFPASAAYFNGSFQPTKKQGLDCVVAKLNASGSSFAWATYLGGSGDDGTQPSVRVDGQGDVWYVAGANSTNLPLQNAAQPQPGGGVDLYLAKLSPDGKQLLVGTYLGGSSTEGSETHNLAVNRVTGDVYIGSATGSSNLPTTSNALQPFAGGGGDAMIARYNSAGTLLSLSYLGGPGRRRHRRNRGRRRWEGVCVGNQYGAIPHRRFRWAGWGELGRRTHSDPQSGTGRVRDRTRRNHGRPWACGCHHAGRRVRAGRPHGEHQFPHSTGAAVPIRRQHRRRMDQPHHPALSGGSNRNTGRTFTLQATSVRGSGPLGGFSRSGSRRIAVCMGHR